MGSSVSVQDASVINITDDGSMGLSTDFAKSLHRIMPAPFNAKNPVVTKKHEELIKTNWAAIHAGTSAFDPAKHLTPIKFLHQTFYQALFVSAPSLRSMFRSSMTVQGKTLTMVLETLITIVRGPNFVSTIQEMARRHLQYGVAKKH
ncbi:hypothetical protein As57867_004458, partial [Aphanomyces stellatus]